MNKQVIFTFVVGTCNFERLHKSTQAQFFQAGCSQIHMLITPRQLLAVDGNVAVFLMSGTNRFGKNYTLNERTIVKDFTNHAFLARSISGSIHFVKNTSMKRIFFPDGVKTRSLVSNSCGTCRSSIVFRTGPPVADNFGNRIAIGFCFLDGSLSHHSPAKNDGEVRFCLTTNFEPSGLLLQTGMVHRIL